MSFLVTYSLCESSTCSNKGFTIDKRKHYNTVFFFFFVKMESNVDEFLSSEGSKYSNMPGINLCGRWEMYN